MSLFTCSFLLFLSLSPLVTVLALKVDNACLTGHIHECVHVATMVHKGRKESFLCIHVQKAIILLSYRWYAYKKTKFHYFLFDFCYFTNILTLVYIWIPSFIIDDSYRGELFTTCFSFAMGPLVSAIVLWRNSLVPHSIDKMTSLFIHISPSLTLWGIRWFVHTV